jgi:hypothetical protein
MATVDYQICLAQATAGAETWTSISALGGSRLRRELRVCGMDYAEFTVNSATALTDTPAFAYKATVRLRRVVDGTPSYWFVGRIMTQPKKGSGASEKYTVRIEGPWSWFENTTFRQPWAASGGGLVKPRVILFCDQSGARITTGSQIVAAAEFARAAGCPIAAVTSATVATGYTPPFDEQINIKVADVVCKAMALHPHASCWFDYSQRDAVFHVATRSALTAVEYSVAGRKDIEIGERTDMQVPAIALCYEQSGSVDGQPFVNTTLDWAPVVSGESTAARDARLAQVDVLWACYNLQGAQVTTVSQSIVAEAFPSTYTLAWWRARAPTLSEFADADISISNVRRLYLSSLSNLLVSGEKQTWMTTVSVEKEHIRADVSYVKRALIDGVSTVIDQGVKSITLEVWVTGAAIGETVYRTPVSVDEGEPVPSGIAAQLYAEWSQLHYQGTLVLVGDDLPGDAVPGKALNLTGGETAWASMAAMIISSSEDADTSETEIAFGIPDWTDIDSRVAFARATRTRNPAESRVWQMGPSATGVSGSVAATVIRDGNVDAGYVRQLFAATGSVRHKIIIDADAFSKSTDATAASVIQPREILVPFIDASDGDKVKARPCQVLASAPYGTAVAVGASELATATPAAVAATGAVGESLKAAREDHVHAGAALSDATPSAVAASGAAGDATAAARANHVHAGVQLSSATPEPISGTGSSGSGTSAARSDHTHALTLTVPGPGPDTGTTVPDGGSELMPAPSGFLGLDAAYSRRDHSHPVNVSAALPAAVADTASAGVSLRYSREDHVHVGGSGSLDTVAPLADGTAAVGVSTKGAHGDHVHPSNVGATAPSAPNTAAAAGSSLVYARVDHVHPARATGLGSVVTMANSGTAAAQTAFGWLVGNAGRNPVKRWFHRVWYRSTAGSEALIGTQHYEINDAVTGALIEVGPESDYVIHVPELGV